MNSPGLQMRNMSTTLLEPANTPIAFGKHDHSESKATPMPVSPSFGGPVGSTPHKTSTPVVPCKSALVHSRREDCMLDSSLTPTKSDSTVNYAITNGPTSPNPTTSQNPNIIHIPTPLQSQKANQSQQLSSGQSIHTKDGTTDHSFISLSQLHDTFRYPGDPVPKKSSSHGENSVQAKTELDRGTKQEETSPVICIEESPPNSQDINLNDISDVKSDGTEQLLSTKAADQLLEEKHTSQESVSKTPDLRPVDSERAESPVLFDTPGCIGGPQSLAAKLSNIVNSKKQPTSGQSNSNADFDDDKTPPISPDDNTTEEKETNEVDGQPSLAQQKDKKNVCANLSCNDMTANNESPDKRSTSKRQPKRNSALGQPRTRRANTRMATRKSTVENNACGSSEKYTVKTPGINESVENDEDDFVPDKRTPRKQATVAEPMDVQVGSEVFVHVYPFVYVECDK